MKLQLRNGLPFVEVVVDYRRRELKLNNVLLDTGSASTIFSTDKLLMIDLLYEPEDFVHRIRGVGGAEFVFTKRVDRLEMEPLTVHDFEIEVGAMDYGFEIDGIVGMDFLMRVGAVIDLSSMELRPSTA